MRSLGRSADSARHSEEVLHASNALERRVIDLETGLRGYLLARDERFLEPYVEARGAIPARLRRARRPRARARRRPRHRRVLAADIDDYMRSYAAPLRAAGSR